MCPKYSNPTGVTYSTRRLRRFAALKPAAKDFRIMWDNAYCVHDLTDTPDTLLNLYEECLKQGTEDNVLFFASTSKISFPGAGVAALGASARNIVDLKKRFTTQTIGPDKLNQLRHILFLHDLDGVYSLMQGHRKILEPKSALWRKPWSGSWGDLGVARWSHPNGGYFVNLDVMNGCAKRVVELCRNAGVVLTDAGAHLPLRRRPQRQQHPHRPLLPAGGGTEPGHAPAVHLRHPGGLGEAALRAVLNNITLRKSPGLLQVPGFCVLRRRQQGGEAPLSRKAA